MAGSLFTQDYPVVNASGGRIAFSSFENGKRLVYVAAPGGPPEKLCEGCLRATDWSRDENELLVFGGNPYQINLLDIASHQQTPILKHASYPLLYGRFSPDNRWISFTARIGPNRGWIVIAPLDGPNTFRRTPGSGSPKKARKTGPTGRRTGRSSISVLVGMEIRAYGDSGSTPAPIGQRGRRSRCSICMTIILSTGRLVCGGRADRDGAPRRHRQYLDDDTLGSTDAEVKAPNRPNTARISQTPRE